MLPDSQSHQIITCHVTGIQSISFKQNSTSCSPVHRFITHTKHAHAWEKMKNNMHLFGFENFMQEIQMYDAIVKYFVSQSWHVIKEGQQPWKLKATKTIINAIKVNNQL
jgi:hypothetical protein